MHTGMPMRTTELSNFSGDLKFYCTNINKVFFSKMTTFSCPVLAVLILY